MSGRRSFSRLGARCTIRYGQSNCARENKVLKPPLLRTIRRALSVAAIAAGCGHVLRHVSSQTARTAGD